MTNPPTTPTQEDRLIAALAHLSFLSGFPMVAPLAIYAIKRKESRFIAFHAMQAAVAHAMFCTTALVGGVFFMAVYLIVDPSLGTPGHHPVLGAVAMIAPLLALLMMPLVLLLVQSLAAYSAWQGRSWAIPIAGRLARGILGADQGIANV